MKIKCRNKNVDVFVRSFALWFALTMIVIYFMLSNNWSLLSRNAIISQPHAVVVVVFMMIEKKDVGQNQKLYASNVMESFCIPKRNKKKTNAQKETNVEE